MATAREKVLEVLASHGGSMTLDELEDELTRSNTLAHGGVERIEPIEVISALISDGKIVCENGHPDEHYVRLKIAA